MEKLKIKIHPTFIVFACLLIYFKQGFLFLNYLSVIFIHEFAHAIVARRLGYNIKNIKLIPFGICLNINSNELLPKDEIKIALAGPLINFCLALITMAIWWIFPSLYNYTYMFCYSNFVTGVFNLIPAFPLDGGRVLLSFLKQKSNNKSAIKFCKAINIIVVLVLLAMFIFSCFYIVNLTYLFVIFCVLSGVFDKSNNYNYTFINFGLKKKIGKIIKIKPLFLSEEEPLYRVCRHIDNFSYLKLYIGDAQKNVIATLTEQQFLNLIQRFSASTPIKYAIKYQNKA